MFFSEADIREVTQSVWDLVLHLPAEPSAQHNLPRGGVDLLSGSVHIKGSWNGTITLSCLPNLAQNAASAMYNAPAASLPAADVLDAVGELANMIGGNVRALLPEPCQLSLPSVGAAAGKPLNAKEKVLIELGFLCMGQPFWVQLTGTE